MVDLIQITISLSPLTYLAQGSTHFWLASHSEAQQRVSFQMLHLFSIICPFSAAHSVLQPPWLSWKLVSKKLSIVDLNNKASQQKALACRDANPERGTTHERRIEAEANAEQEAAKEDAAKFEGCYAAIVTTMLHLLPKKVLPPPSNPLRYSSSHCWQKYRYVSLLELSAWGELEGKIRMSLWKIVHPYVKIKCAQFRVQTQPRRSMPDCEYSSDAQSAFSANACLEYSGSCRMPPTRQFKRPPLTDRKFPL